MPGLLRGVARTAVVAGTATAVSNRVSRRQANRWADQYEQPTEPVAAAPPAAPAPPAVASTTASDQVAALRQLGELHANGILDDAEFAVQKAKVLDQPLA
jgi:hypothetical protein